MKRKALLIGYSGWDIKNKKPLSGVKIDIQNYENYLRSFKGGAWLGSEITSLIDEDLSRLSVELIKIKAEHNDVVLVAYSGHGYYSTDKHCRAIEIRNDKVIYEDDLLGFAKRQILILDSCAGFYSESMNEELEKESHILSKSFDIDKILQARKKYEDYCMNCQEQELMFYAAQKGTTARDSEEGGYYTKNLINELRTSNGYIDIASAHDKAAAKVIIETRGRQKPECDIPKIHDFLPGAINI